MFIYEVPGVSNIFFRTGDIRPVSSSEVGVGRSGRSGSPGGVGGISRIAFFAGVINFRESSTGELNWVVIGVDDATGFEMGDGVRPD